MIENIHITGDLSTWPRQILEDGTDGLEGLEGLDLVYRFCDHTRTIWSLHALEEALDPLVTLFYAWLSDQDMSGTLSRAGGQGLVEIGYACALRDHGHRYPDLNQASERTTWGPGLVVAVGYSAQSSDPHQCHFAMSGADILVCQATPLDGLRAVLAELSGTPIPDMSLSVKLLPSTRYERLLRGE